MTITPERLAEIKALISQLDPQSHLARVALHRARLAAIPELVAEVEQLRTPVDPIPRLSATQIRDRLPPHVAQDIISTVINSYRLAMGYGDHGRTDPIAKGANVLVDEVIKALFP
jgi:hypothetical protein